MKRGQKVILFSYTKQETLSMPLGRMELSEQSTHLKKEK